METEEQILVKHDCLISVLSYTLETIFIHYFRKSVDWIWTLSRVMLVS